MRAACSSGHLRPYDLMALSFFWCLLLCYFHKLLNLPVYQYRQHRIIFSTACVFLLFSPLLIFAHRISHTLELLFCTSVSSQSLSSILPCVGLPRTAERPQISPANATLTRPQRELIFYPKSHLLPAPYNSRYFPQTGAVAHRQLFAVTSLPRLSKVHPFHSKFSSISTHTRYVDNFVGSIAHTVCALLLTLCHQPQLCHFFNLFSIILFCQSRCPEHTTSCTMTFRAI